MLVSSALRDGLNDARTGHTATLLPSGDVLIVVGVNTSGPLDTVERFEPAASPNAVEVRCSCHARPAPGQHRTMRSISTSDPRAKLVTPTVVRAGKRPGLK